MASKDPSMADLYIQKELDDVSKRLRERAGLQQATGSNLPH